MFEIPNVKFVYLFSRPINMRWGEKKLCQICKEEMGLDPRSGKVFIFLNRKMDQIKLFFVDEEGSQELIKILPKGGFIVPAPKEGEIFIKIGKNKLNSLFKTTIFG